MKTTLRLPETLLEELRVRSREEHRSVNAVAVDALWRGLGREPEVDEVARILGPLVSEPATKRFDPEEFRRSLAGIEGLDAGLMDALDWAREDRF